ncbi:MAG TPA: T9SS type A sorting domain-containing protein [Ignavibacteria bacterium]
MIHKLIILSVFSLVQLTYSQWQPDVRLTYAPGVSEMSYGGRSIAVNGNTIHIAWADFRDGGNPEIYYKSSTNAGITWFSDTRLTNTSPYSSFPSIAVSGSSVHIVYTEGSNQIRYLYSLNGGFSWVGTTLTMNSNSIWDSPTLAIEGQRLYVVWSLNVSGSPIYYMLSTNGGANWSGATALTNSSGRCYSPSIAASGMDVHLAWTDTRNGVREVFYKRSTDGGFFWGVDTRIIYVSTLNYYPSIAAAGDIIYLVWEDSRNGSEIYYTRSGNRGVFWSPEIRLTNAPGTSTVPHISVSSSYVHLVWRDSRSGNYEIYHKLSSDGGLSWGTTDTRLTIDPANSESPSLGISGSILHVVWDDNRDGNSEIYYKRNPTGNPVGITPVNSEIPDEFSLEQNYPNPFNPTTNVKFQISKSSQVKLTVYDILGKEAAILANERLNPGTYEVEWNASSFPSGVYFYTLKAGYFSETKKLVLLK